MTRKEVIKALKAYRQRGYAISCNLNASTSALYDAFYDAFGAYPCEENKYTLDTHALLSTEHYLDHTQEIDEWIEVGYGSYTMDRLELIFHSDGYKREKLEESLKLAGITYEGCDPDFVPTVNIDDTNMSHWTQDDLLQEILFAAQQGKQIECCIDGSRDKLFQEYLRLYDPINTESSTSNTPAIESIVEDSTVHDYLVLESESIVREIVVGDIEPSYVVLDVTATSCCSRVLSFPPRYRTQVFRRG